MFRYFLNRPQRLTDLFKALQKECADLLVALRELSGNSVQQRANPVFRKRHDPGDDPRDALGPTRTERPKENAGLVGIEDCGCTFEVNGHGSCRLIPEDDRPLKARQYVLRQLHLCQ